MKQAKGLTEGVNVTESTCVVVTVWGGGVGGGCCGGITRTVVHDVV